ncbi:hypothetical protein Tco_0352973 [Tanacetum coccineum]
MGDENPIRTLGDYSKPSHEGYKNTIELPVGNNVVPLRSDTIRLVQNGCSFHGLRSEDPNQHLKDFLKLEDSLDIDGRCVSPYDISVLQGQISTEQAFVEYASSRTDEAGSKWATLPSDTVKNPKLETHPVSFARSYPTMDPQCSSYPYTSINAIKAHFKEVTISQTSLQQPEVEIEPQQPEEPEQPLEDEF